jgi:hypothetical protein
MRKLSSLWDRLRPTSVAAQCLISIVVRPASWGGGIRAAFTAPRALPPRIRHRAAAGRPPSRRSGCRSPRDRPGRPRSRRARCRREAATPPGPGLELGLPSSHLCASAASSRRWVKAGLDSRDARGHRVAGQPAQVLELEADLLGGAQAEAQLAGGHGGAAGDDLDRELAGVRRRYSSTGARLPRFGCSSCSTNRTRRCGRPRPADQHAGRGRRPDQPQAHAGGAGGQLVRPARAAGAQALELAGDLAADALEPAGVLEGESVAEHEQRRAPEVAAGALLTCMRSVRWAASRRRSRHSWDLGWRWSADLGSERGRAAWTCQPHGQPISAVAVQEAQRGLLSTVVAGREEPAQEPRGCWGRGPCQWRPARCARGGLRGGR